MPFDTSAFRSFLRDEDGSITVEFVIWTPILLIFFMFTTTLYFAMDSRLDALRASITITDIVSRETQFDGTFLANLSVLNDQLLESDAGQSTLRVSSIINDNGTFRVQWTECVGAIGPLTDTDIPLEVIPPMAPLTTVILTEMTVPYQPISSSLGFQPMEWVNRKAVMPRFVPAITNDNPQNCATNLLGG